MLRHSARWLPLLSVLFLVLTWPSLALAHGTSATSQTPVVDNRIVGPYRLSVWAGFHPGVNSFVIEPTQNGVSVATDTVVAMALKPMDNSLAQRAYASRPDPQDPRHLLIDAPLASLGDWEGTLEISGPSGSGTTAFYTTVREARTDPPGWLMAAALLGPWVVLGSALVLVRLRNVAVLDPAPTR